ncbi:MAG TPA: AMP-binding protein, partial [Pseudonocardiaceae bacterium]|nr:AMP-binding protein [Pseudonocardiaceae bacterium]
MPDITCADRFATIAHDTADSIAVRHNETSLTYRELAGQAGGIAHLLTGCGIRPGDVVATVLDRSPLALAAMLGIWAAGAAYANIEPAEPDSRITRALPETEARVILADRANARRVPGSVVLDDVTDAPYQPVTGRAKGDLAYLAIVPSPTGAPKAVQV